MNTFTSKFSAFAATVAINGLLMAGVLYLFALQAQPHLSAISFARAIVTHQWLT
jgi:hypothetical protein